MPFDSTNFSANQAFALSTRETFARTEDDGKRMMAQKHLHEAEIAERCNHEAKWILAIDRAARALA